jgi:hypothetical protein
MAMLAIQAMVMQSLNLSLNQSLSQKQNQSRSQSLSHGCLMDLAFSTTGVALHSRRPLKTFVIALATFH